MPSRVELTKTLVERLTLPDRGSAYIYDSKVPSLAVCVTANGAKTFYRVGRVRGRFKRIKLGRFGSITVQQARELAAQTTVAIHAGKSHLQPVTEGRMTLGSLWVWYLENHAKPRKRTWQTDARRWDAHLKAWQHEPIGNITRSEIVALHAEKKKAIGPCGANHVLEQLRHMLQMAVEQGWINANPASGIKRFPRKSRDRFLSESELPRFLDAVRSLRNQNARDFFLLALMTGARRGNVMAMRWSELDLDAGVWRIPGDKSKNKSDMLVALAKPAVAILRARRSPSPWVFPSHSKCGHYLWPKDAWKAVLRKSGIEGLRTHDLRRTLASWQVSIGSNIAVIGSSLGHKSLSSTAVYARTQIDQVRASVDGAVQAMLKTEDAK